MRIEGVWVSVIRVYAPTEDSKNEMEESKIHYRLHFAKARNERSTERCESGKRAEIGSNHYHIPLET